MWSPLATRATGVLDPVSVFSAGVKRVPWGALVHTTGRGILTSAVLHRRTPLQEAISVYRELQKGSEGYLWGGPGYVIDGGGQIAQLAPDDVLTHHCGGPNRGKYLSGEWRNLVPEKALEHWTARWPGVKHPYSLFPSTSPNKDYIGIELIPTIRALYTEAQIAALDALLTDIARRNKFPAHWRRTIRLVGHEDVDPISRSDRGGGWDPGALRDVPRFDWAKLIKDEV